MSEKDLEELGKLPLKNNSSKINSNNSQEEIIKVIIIKRKS